MRHLIKGALIAIIMGGAPVFAAAPALAAVDLSVSLGNAAFGFSDGYWDRDHHWHAWRNKAEQEYFRGHYTEHYTEARHDQDRNDRDQGWRESNRWWQQEGRQEQERH